jgi:hypothetical protein
MVNMENEIQMTLTMLSEKREIRHPMSITPYLSYWCLLEIVLSLVRCGCGRHASSATHAATSYKCCFIAYEDTMQRFSAFMACPLCRLRVKDRRGFRLT